MQKSINIPDELVEVIERIAECEHRSFSSQVVFFLEHAVSPPTTAANPNSDSDEQQQLTQGE